MQRGTTPPAALIVQRRCPCRGGEARRTIGIAAVLRDGHRRAEHRAWSVHRTAGPPERVAIGLGCSKVSSGRVGLTLVRERQGF